MCANCCMSARSSRAFFSLWFGFRDVSRDLWWAKTTPNLTFFFGPNVISSFRFLGFKMRCGQVSIFV